MSHIAPRSLLPDLPPRKSLAYIGIPDEQDELAILFRQAPRRQSVMTKSETLSSTYCDSISSEETYTPAASTPVQVHVATFAHDLLCMGAQFH